MPEYETNTVQYTLLILEITVCIYFQLNFKIIFCVST